MNAGHIEGRTLNATAMVWLFGISQIVGYGTLYYSFSIIAGDVADTVGWPVSWLYASFSVGLLLGGVLAPEVGRRLDRHNAGIVMTIGSVFCGLALLLTAVAPNGITFAVATVGAQVAATLVLYDAAFTALVHAFGSDARRRITHLTLIAGFASTIFWPLTAWLDGLLGWRGILVAFGLANLVICLPIHVVISRHDRRRRGSGTVSPVAPVAASIPPERQTLVLLLATAGFALCGFSLSGLLAQMVPTLAALDVGSAALAVSMLFGPAQFLIRLGSLVVGGRAHPVSSSLVAVTMIPASIAVLAGSAPWVVGALLFIVIFAFGSGLKSISQGTLPLVLFGSHGYGRRLGYMASARQVLAAMAPFAFALMIEMLGARPALVVLAVIAASGVACIAAVAVLVRAAGAPTTGTH